MSILATYDFPYRVGYSDPKKKFPYLANGNGYQISLQTRYDSYTAIVVYDRVHNDICIEVYDGRGELVQTRLRVVENINLLYIAGYELTYSKLEQVFIFGSIE